jgi:5-methyltetrahydrofolate--homocysteine methyltransferase
MTVFKEDFAEAKERLKAWWNHEIIDRPAIGWYVPRLNSAGKGMYDHWYLAQNLDDIDGFLNDFHDKATMFEYGGEIVPSLFLNYGPGIMAALFGCKMEYKSRTVWFERETNMNDIVNVLENAQMNMNNEWYARLIRVTEVAAKFAKTDFSVALTDMGGVLDILASFLTPKGLILAMKKFPNIVDTCRQIILEKWFKVYTDMQNIIERYSEGCNSWLNVWCHKRWYPIQSDFAYMLSPKWFRRFVLPDVVTQAQQLDYSIYHLDGPNQFEYIDDLCSIPELTGIQVVPGAGEKPNGDDKWMPLYKKIQSYGKNLVLDPPSEHIPKMYHELEPKGLFCHTVFAAQIMKEFFLPKFMGGMDGIEEDD